MVQLVSLHQVKHRRCGCDTQEPRKQEKRKTIKSESDKKNMRNHYNRNPRAKPHSKRLQREKT